MRPTALAFMILAALLALSSRSPAQARDGDESEIKAVVQGEADAWNRGDAQAFAAHYSPDGSFTNVIGQQIYGKQGFVDQHQRIFSTIYKGSHNTLAIGKIKFVRPDVAIVDIDGILTGASRLPPGLKAAADGAVHVKLQEVMTKENGSWWVAAFHNVAVYPMEAGK